MSTETEESGAASVQGFPDVLAVIAGTLTVMTDDDNIGMIAVHGFEYLLSCEFYRQQPALALLYEFDFVLSGPTLGSLKFNFQIVVRIKDRVKAEIKKAGAVAVISAALGIPGTALASVQLYEALFPPVQTHLNSAMPQAPTIIEVYVIVPDE